MSVLQGLQVEVCPYRTACHKEEWETEERTACLPEGTV